MKIYDAPELSVPPDEPVFGAPTIILSPLSSVDTLKPKLSPATALIGATAPSISASST